MSARKTVLIGAGSASFTQEPVVDMILTGDAWDLHLVDIDPENLSAANGLVHRMLAMRPAITELTVDAALSGDLDPMAQALMADGAVVLPASSPQPGPRVNASTSIHLGGEMPDLHPHVLSCIFPIEQLKITRFYTQKKWR